MDKRNTFKKALATRMAETFGHTTGSTIKGVSFS